MCLWCYVHLAQAGVINNYTRVLYIQGACIFMQGVVMERVLHLQRSGVGGNFFHTLGFTRLAHQCNPKLFPIQVLFRWASTAHPCQTHRRSRKSPNALDARTLEAAVVFDNVTIDRRNWYLIFNDVRKHILVCPK